MAQPEVIQGPRGPKNIEAMRRSAEAKAPIRPIIEGTVYVSAYRRYRVQVTSPADQFEPSTGRVIRGRPIVAQFEDWQYVNNHKDAKTRKLIDEALSENPRFGLSLDFWTLTEQQERAQEKKMSDARETLRRLPREVVVDFLASLEMGNETDHALPEPTEKK